MTAEALRRRTAEHEAAYAAAALLLDLPVESVESASSSPMTPTMAATAASG